MTLQPGATLAGDGRSYAREPQAQAQPKGTRTTAIDNRSSLVVVNAWSEQVKHTIARQRGGATVITTAALKIVVSAAAGEFAVSFFNASSGTSSLGRQTAKQQTHGARLVSS